MYFSNTTLFQKLPVQFINWPAVSADMIDKLADEQTRKAATAIKKLIIAQPAHKSGYHDTVIAFLELLAHLITVIADEDRYRLYAMLPAEHQAEGAQLLGISDVDRVMMYSDTKLPAIKYVYSNDPLFMLINRVIAAEPWSSTVKIAGKFPNHVILATFRNYIHSSERNEYAHAVRLRDIAGK